MPSVGDRVETAIARLNGNLALVEEKLEELNLSVSATVEMEDGLGYLSFQKLGQRWRLCVSREVSATGYGESPILLSSCSLEVRTKAVDYLERLAEKLLYSAEGRVSVLERASAELEAFLAKRL